MIEIIILSGLFLICALGTLVFVALLIELFIDNPKIDSGILFMCGMLLFYALCTYGMWRWLVRVLEGVV